MSDNVDSTTEMVVQGVGVSACNKVLGIGNLVYCLALYTDFKGLFAYLVPLSKEIYNNVNQMEIIQKYVKKKIEILFGTLLFTIFKINWSIPQDECKSSMITDVHDIMDMDFIGLHKYLLGNGC